MKKIMTLTIAALLIAMSGTSPAKEPISDSDLATMTAEAGVTINMDDFSTGSISIAVTSWGDADGFLGYGSAGYAGMTDLEMTGDVASFSGDMKIDVGSNATQTRVNIELPTLTLGSTDVSSVMKIGGAQNLSGAKTMGTLDIVGLQTEISGSMQVYAH